MTQLLLPSRMESISMGKMKEKYKRFQLKVCCYVIDS